MLGYNRMTGYNKARYNAEGAEMSASDTLTLTDNTITRQFLKGLSDLIVMLDDTAKEQSKVVEETIRIDAWTSIDRNDSDQWSD